MARKAQAIGEAGGLRVENPAGQVGQAFLHTHLRGQVSPVQPQFGVRASAELLGEQSLVPRGSFPGDMARRVADVILPQTGEILMPPAVVAARPGACRRWR